MPQAEVWRDFARVHHSHRPGIEPGTVCWLKRGDKKRLVVVRGIDAEDNTDIIRLDERTRDKLGIRRSESYGFEIWPASCWREFQWAWLSTDPGNRIAARLSLLSFGLGVLGLLLGAWSICLALKS